MSRRIGVAIGDCAIHAIWVRRDAIKWSATAPLPNAGELGEALNELFAKAPRAMTRRSLSVVFSAAWVQVKPLAGLPKLEHPRLVNQALRENEQSFFLWRGAPALIADVHLPKDGAPWGAAYYSSAVEALVRFARARRLRLAGIAPAVTAVSALPNPEPPALRRLGDGALTFTAAYAAAVAPRRLPLSLRPPRDEARRRVRSRIVASLTVAAICASAAFAALGPGLRADRFVRAHRDEVVRAGTAQADLAREQAELKRVTQALDRVNAFTGERGTVSRLLASISQAIPESTALLTLHVDSAEGSFMAIAPHVSDVLPELTSVDVFGPRIVGSVTRETIGGARVERAGFRFRRRAAGPNRRRPQ